MAASFIDYSYLTNLRCKTCPNKFEKRRKKDCIPNKSISLTRTTQMYIIHKKTRKKLKKIIPTKYQK